VRDYVVMLGLDTQELSDDLKRLLDCLSSLRSKEVVFRKFLRAVDMFSSAVSQVGYVSYMFLLAVSLEVFAKSVSAYLKNERCSEYQSMEKRLGMFWVNKYGLYIEWEGRKYSLIA